MLIFFPSRDPLLITACEKLRLIYQIFAGGGPRAQLRSGAGVRCVWWRCKGCAGSWHHGRPSGRRRGEEPTGRVEVARTPVPATSPPPPCPPSLPVSVSSPPGGPSGHAPHSPAAVGTVLTAAPRGAGQLLVPVSSGAQTRGCVCLFQGPAPPGRKALSAEAHIIHSSPAAGPSWL